MATVHPYKGFINTKFFLYAKGTEEVAYEVTPINGKITSPIIKGSFYPTIPHELKLKNPGTYQLVFSDGTVSEIIVEDGYKFGGSMHKKHYIFDETPWCLVIMNDRTYFYNRDTEESYMELVSPDTITVISENYLLFENNGHNERTIYSLVEERPILNISDIVTYNKETLVWKETLEDNTIRLNIFSLVEKIIIKSISVKEFVADLEDNSVIYATEGAVCKQKLTLPLLDEQLLRIRGKFLTLVSPNLVISRDKFYSFERLYIFDTRDCNTISDIDIDSPIASINSKILIDVNERTDTIRSFDFSLIGCEEAFVKAIYLSINFYSTKWDIYYTIAERTCKKNKQKFITKYSYKLKSALTRKEYLLKNDIISNNVVVQDNCICLYNYYESIVCGKNFSPIYSENTKVFIHNNNVVQQIDGTLFVLYDIEGWKPLCKGNFSFQNFCDFGIITDTDKMLSFDLLGHTYTGRVCVLFQPIKHIAINDTAILPNGRISPNCQTSMSESGKFGLAVEDGGIFVLVYEQNNITRKRILSDIYDTSSYKSVLLSEDGSQILYRNEEEAVVLDLNSNQLERFDNVSYIKDINGMLPHFSRRAGSLQPRLVDSITGQIISSQRMLNYQFVSPDGMLYADTEIHKYVETRNLITNDLLSEQDVFAYDYNFDYDINSEDDRQKKNKEKRRRFIIDNLNYFKTEYSNRYPEQHLDIVEQLVQLPYSKFKEFILDERGIALIRNTVDNSIIAKIELGRPLWFLNYVSFSYDNRYVAIAGRYPNGSCFGGLFLVYDLKGHEYKIFQTNSWAVWLTAFNKHNQVAAYSSEPILYEAIISDGDDKVSVNKYNGYNFLTFSPDGKFAALSKQGYVSKYSSRGFERMEWGHRPSCDVFVVSSLQMDYKLKSYNDLSDKGIAGVSDKNYSSPRTVASVSFSNDNKRLMMVGNDGVVIIRNLHLEDYASK